MENADIVDNVEAYDKAERPDRMEQQDNFLVPRQTYLASGIHIGMKQKFEHMSQFVYKVRPDGLAVMNLQMIDDRIRTSAKFMAKAKNIVVVSRKNIAFQAVEKFSEIVGAHKILGRYMPGTLTNPSYKSFVEADIVLIVDPVYDYQVLKEAETARVPLFAICGTSNETNGIDFIIPANNKSAKSLATLFWLLAREILKARGGIAKDEDYKFKVSDFFKEGMAGEGEGYGAYGMGSQEFPDDAADRGISQRTRDRDMDKDRDRRPMRTYRRDDAPASMSVSLTSKPAEPAPERAAEKAAGPAAVAPGSEPKEAGKPTGKNKAEDEARKEKASGSE